MASKDFLLPDLGEGLTEGEVVSWLVAVGDTIDIDQNIAEIETAKAVVEVPSPYAGTVLTLHGEPGEEVAVGTPLITVEVPDDTDAPMPPEEPPPSTPIEDQIPVVEADDTDGGSGNVLVGYGTSGAKGSRRRRVGGTPPPAQPVPQQAPVVNRNGRPLAKPPVRKLAKDAGIDLASVQGSAPDGRITRSDVEAAIDAAVDPAAPPGGPAADLVPSAEDYAQQLAPKGEQPLAASQAVPTQPVTATAQRIPMGQMRKTIAAQMSRSRKEIPEAVTWVEADATPLWELREQLNQTQDDVKVSPLAIIMRMVVAALRKYPSLNASLDTQAQEIVLHNDVHLGFAAQTDRGLVVPVIKNAHTMNIVTLAQALNDMAATAREGKLAPKDMAGGTFTVSNYGAFGVDGGDMVINHPEAAILGTGKISDKPWVHGGAIKIRKVMTYSVAFDHRICDGGEAGGFLRYLADMTENPVQLTAAL